MIPGVPYDAEVEYLESTGTQWIDTGIIPNSTIRCKCKFMLNVIPSDTFAAAFGSLLDNRTTGIFLALNYTVPVQARTGDGSNPNIISTFSVMKDYDYEVDLSFNALKVNGLAFSPTQNNSWVSLSNSLYVFSVSGAYESRSRWRGRYYYFTIWQNDLIVRDFIPVRFTNELGVSEGAMYDRVTKKLFRKQGAGSFVLGPDVAKPVMGLHFMKPHYVAKDYVQDGLVAMWDGIENAGWGQSSDLNEAIDLSGKGHNGIFRGNMCHENNYFWIPKTDKTLLRGALYSFLSISEYEDVLKECTMELVVDSCPQELFYYDSLYHKYMVVGGFLTCSQHSGGDIYYGYRMWAGNYNFGGFNKRMVIHMRSKGTNGEIIINNVKRTWTISSTVDSKMFGLTGGVVNNQYTYNYAESGCKNYSFRLYSRALSDAEIEYNDKIDKARFNLP